MFVRPRADGDGLDAASANLERISQLAAQAREDLEHATNFRDVDPANFGRLFPSGPEQAANGQCHTTNLVSDLSLVLDVLEPLAEKLAEVRGFHTKPKTNQA